MSYAEWNLDAALKIYFDSWAERNNYKILNCTANDTPSLRAYAEDVGGICVPDPRGLEGKVIVVKLV